MNRTIFEPAQRRACAAPPCGHPPPEKKNRVQAESRTGRTIGSTWTPNLPGSKRRFTKTQRETIKLQASSVVHGKGLVSSADLKIRRDSFPSGEVRKPLAGFSPSVIIDTCLRENCIGWSTPLGKRRRKDRQAPTQPAMSGLQ